MPKPGALNPHFFSRITDSRHGHAGAVAAGDARQGGAVEVAGDILEVCGVHASGLYPDERFAGAGFRQRNFLNLQNVGRPEGVEAQGFHTFLLCEIEQHHLSGFGSGRLHGDHGFIAQSRGVPGFERRSIDEHSSLYYLQPGVPFGGEIVTQVLRFG